MWPSHFVYLQKNLPSISPYAQRDMLKESFIFQKSSLIHRSYRWGAGGSVAFTLFCQIIHFMPNRTDHFAESLVQWFPGSHWWSITPSHSGPFVSTVNSPETYGYDLHRFFHLCCFLMHNNELPAFISVNDLWMEEMFPCYVACLMLPDFRSWNSLAWCWPEKGHPPPCCRLIASPHPKRRASEKGSLG